MNTVSVHINGILFAEGRPVSEDPVPVLNHAVTLAPDVSLRDYFRLLERYPLLIRFNTFFAEYMDRYFRCPERHCHTDHFDSLEFGKSIEMIGFPGTPRLEIFTWLKGLRGKTHVPLQDYSLECLLDMPLQLGCLKHVVFGDNVDTFEFETVFTLFEFVDGIAWDLSFQNIPITCTLRR